MRNGSNATLLIDLHYLPSLAYLTRLLPHTTVRIEAQENYQKQTYRNRCYILTAQQVDRLTVPVCKSSSKAPYRKVKIDDSQPWVDVHWRAFCTAYGKAPYFAYFADYVRAIFLERHTYLFDLNLALLKTCLQLLQLDKHLELSSHYDKAPGKHLVDARGSIHPHNRLIGSNHYLPVQYPQVFGNTFHPNLSIIDLLCCEGPNASTILQQSLAHKILD